MRFPRKRGSTSVMIRVFIPDNSVTTGAGCSGLVYNSTNLAVAYSRELQNGFTQITGANLVDIATIGTWASPGTGKLGFKAVDATNAKGLYEIHFPDNAAAFGTGDTSSALYINVLELTTAALKIGPCMVLIPLVPWDYQDGVRMGLTALPAAAADAAGGLPISDAGGLDMDAILARIGTPVDLGGGTATLAGNLADIEAETDDIGAAGAGLTALGDTRLANLDAAISTRPTFAGGAVASVGSGVTLAAGQKVDVDTIKTQAITCGAPVTVLASVGTASASTAQTGDVATLITTVGVAGAGLTALGDTRLANLDATVSSRSTFAGGAVASVTGSVGSVASYGTLVTDVATAVWGAGTRTLTSLGSVVGDTAAAVWGAATRVLTAGTNIVLAKGSGVTGFNDIAATAIVSDGAITTAGGKVSSVGTVDTLTTYSGNTPQTGDAYLAAGVLATAIANKTGYRLSADGVNDVLRSVLTETYAADGDPMTVEQALHMIWSMLCGKEIVGTTLTTRKLNGTTAAMTFALDSATAPTSQARAT